MAGILNNIYKNLPVPIQNLAISAYGYGWKKRRFGGIFEEELKGFKLREEWDFNQWRDYQTIQLRNLLLHAFETVPYYNAAFRDVHLTKSTIESFELEDLGKVPILEKDALRKLGTTDLLSVKREEHGKYFTSSGSTGTPVKILFSESMHQKWRAAFEARIYNWAGITHNDSRGMIGGRLVVPGGSKAKPPFYRYNYFEKQIYFSIYHIRKQNAWNYLEAIKKYKPNFMTGYAASNFLLASYFEELGFDVQPLKAVITSSEKLTGSMRSTLSRVYQCNVYDSWSGIEACGMISENSNGLLYSSPDIGLIEVLDDDFNPVKEGEIGSVYCTGFLNYDQPLIRYKIGDLARMGNAVSMAGPQMPVITEIVGRIDDVVTLIDGRQFSSFNRFFADIEEIKEVQVEQLSFHELVLHMVVTDSYNSEVEQSILKSIRDRIGEIKVVFNVVENIPRNANGKFKAVVSHVK